MGVPTSGASTTATGDSAGPTEESAVSSDETGPNPDDDTGQSSSDTTGTTADLPSDPPPTVTDLVCDPEKAEEIGPSAPHNNPGSTITVRVRDEAGQTADTSIYQPSTVKDPGTEVWTKLEPNDGEFSVASAIALQGNYVIAAGMHWTNPKMVGTLRRYDLGGEWEATVEGWSKPHTEWTQYSWLQTGYLGPTGLAVDAAGHIILVGIGYENGAPRSYVARFHPDGKLHWEKPGSVGTEARAVGVQVDGTIYAAGAKRTGVNPERWDMEISVFGPDKTAYGPFPYSDPEDESNNRSERGRAVAVLKNGRVVVGGTREIFDPNDPNKYPMRGVALLFEGKGKFVDVWTSSGDKLEYDGILAAVATAEGFATCGYAEEDPNLPGSKKQILIRWHGEDLQEIQAPRLETTAGAAVCTALGYNMEGATIVGAYISENGQNNNQWIFAVENAASVRVDYREHNGLDSGDDRVTALDCEYKCAWAGAESVGGDIQWIAGLFRG